MSRKVTLVAEDLRRTLARMAHEIIEANRALEEVVLVGMHTRGAPLARRLGANIEGFKSVSIPVGALDITPYRDDRCLNKNGVVQVTDIPTDITGRAVVLVDDVLYTGRSIRAAMDALMDRGRPKSIQLAVLIDRGHRELPIRADYVGKSMPTARDEEIQVRVEEIDGVDEVAIVRPDER